jgi:hypothetical protein
MMNFVFHVNLIDFNRKIYFAFCDVIFGSLLSLCFGSGRTVSSLSWLRLCGCRRPIFARFWTVSYFSCNSSSPRAARTRCPVWFPR